MLTYTVQQKNGFHGGTAESFQLVEKDGQHLVNGVVYRYGRAEPLSSPTGRWIFRDGGAVLLDVDLDEKNGTEASA